MNPYKISEYNLKGMVKSVSFKSDECQSKSKEINENKSNRSLKQSYFLNTDNTTLENNNLQHELIFNEFGFLFCSKSFLSTTYFFYDDLHRIIECKKCIRNNEKPSQIEKFTYGIDGLLEEKTEWDYTNSYDEFATELIFTDKGRLTRLTKYIYNTKNLLIEEKEYYDELKHKCISTIRYKYDSYNNLIEILSYWENNHSIIIHRNFEYNSKNLLIKKWWTDQSSIGIIESHRSFSDYDENIIIHSETTNWSHTNDTIILCFKYNDFNDPIIVEVLLTKKHPNKEKLTETISYEYKYDENNNWIEKREYISGIQTNNIIRQIEYFK